MFCDNYNDNYNVKVSKFSVAQYFSNRYCRSLINFLGFSWSSDQNSNATIFILFHHTDILKTYAWTFKSNPTHIPSVLISSQNLRSFRLLGPENLNSLLGLNVAMWVVCPNTYLSLRGQLHITAIKAEFKSQFDVHGYNMNYLVQYHLYIVMPNRCCFICRYPPAHQAWPVTMTLKMELSPTRVPWKQNMWCLLRDCPPHLSPNQLQWTSITKWSLSNTGPGMIDCLLLLCCEYYAVESSSNLIIQLHQIIYWDLNFTQSVYL